MTVHWQGDHGSRINGSTCFAVIDSHGGYQQTAEQVTTGQGQQTYLIAKALRLEPPHVVVAEISRHVRAHVNESDRNGRGRGRQGKRGQRPKR